GDCRYSAAAGKRQFGKAGQRRRHATRLLWLRRINVQTGNRTEREGSRAVQKPLKSPQRGGAFIGKNKDFFVVAHCGILLDPLTAIVPQSPFAGPALNSWLLPEDVQHDDTHNSDHAAEREPVLSGPIVHWQTPGIRATLPAVVEKTAHTQCFVLQIECHELLQSDRPVTLMAESS
ncbi:MAG: hypothetical protein ACM3U2_18770, partial [Deltaproteobacteria bacterium]